MRADLTYFLSAEKEEESYHENNNYRGKNSNEN